MLLRHQLSLRQIFRLTWKVDLLILLCCTAAYLMDTYLIQGHISIPSSISAVLGTAIAFFIGFNNNQAYGRWWEARIIWGGLVNDSRSWARSLLHYVDTSDDAKAADIVERMIYRHIAFLYALKAGLRRNGDRYYTRYLTEGELSEVDDQANTPNAILDLQARDLQELSKRHAIDGFRFRDISDLLVKLCDGMGKSERINNTVFPPSYIFFTRVFIWFYVIMNTLMMTETVDYWAILFGWAFGFVFHVTHQNGVSIMNPFEENQTSIPLDSITRTIEINLMEMMGEADIPAPVAPSANGIYIT
ncbi:hypothetical protein KTO58_26415 [Chitinophaga pendula]|uniref:bestrophin family protein n=1 Tax=Chitinophaga TaxID=79328 RepID=UPI000BAF2B67|nr:MULTISPECIES: bestrophin family ion channel [Chitinophaga]ASZ09904.1 hypothetical protein CK934_02360 [Chitinophaga sp. MD30]UCJ07156.1 hypothetical protein KTO58_26415 [Chitinophaga pendula]